MPITFLINYLKVCPTFSAPLVKKILYSFVPDEFCPNPIPEAVLDALDSEVIDYYVVMSLP